MHFCLIILFMGFLRQEYWSGLPFPIVDGDYIHEIKRHLLLGRKAMTKLILKSRDITLLIKVHIVFSSSHVWM